MEKYINKIQESITTPVTNIELISETSNKVFKITLESGEILYAKFYEGNSYHIDNELKVYDLVDNKYLKEIYFKSLDYKMAIFKELIGKTVDELNEEEIDKYGDKIIDSIIEYFTSISKTKTEGYGSLNNELKGNYNSFIEFLKTRQGETSKELNKYKELSIISKLIFEKFEDILTPDNSLVPIDTNMKNIMVLNTGEIKFIDPGEMISAPILMGYGDFIAHSYKTKLYKKLISRLNLTETEEKLVRIYAIFSSLNILAFLNKLGVEHLEEVIPYGNSETFQNLIIDHLSHLDINEDTIKKTLTKESE